MIDKLSSIPVVAAIAIILIFLSSITSQTHSKDVSKANMRQNHVFDPGSPSFECKGHHPGYYADVQSNCQVYHLCLRYGRGLKFNCPEKTRFEQRTLVCNHERSVRCDDSHLYFHMNRRIGHSHLKFIQTTDDHVGLKNRNETTETGRLHEPHLQVMVRVSNNQPQDDLNSKSQSNWRPLQTTTSPSLNDVKPKQLTLNMSKSVNLNVEKVRTSVTKTNKNVESVQTSKTKEKNNQKFTFVRKDGKSRKLTPKPKSEGKTVRAWIKVAEKKRQKQPFALLMKMIPPPKTARTSNYGTMKTPTLISSKRKHRMIKGKRIDKVKSNETVDDIKTETSKKATKILGVINISNGGLEKQRRVLMSINEFMTFLKQKLKNKKSSAKIRQNKIKVVAVPLSSLKYPVESLFPKKKIVLKGKKDDNFYFTTTTTTTHKPKTKSTSEVRTGRNDLSVHHRPQTWQNLRKLFYIPSSSTS